MIYRAEPIRLGKRYALVVGYRHERGVGKTFDHRGQASQIQTAMQGGKEGHAEPAEQRQVQPIDMGMNNVELGGVLGYCL